MNKNRRLAVVAVYAVAMAWVEAAVVFYLRTMVNRIEPYQIAPLPVSVGIGPAEVVREAATLIMLLIVGILAGSKWPQRIAYSAIAFGLWDIFYYVFLRVLCGWPHSLLDWDVLFLIPLPWWGPVLAPILISLLMISWGFQVLRSEASVPAVFPKGPWALNASGILLALYVFMTDALHAASGGEAALRNLLPTHFNWTAFVVALALMAAPFLFSLYTALKNSAKSKSPSMVTTARG